MSHILIVGGTGMLRDAALYFTQHYSTVSVIARHQDNLDKLISDKGENGFINPLKVDYNDSHMLKKRILSAIDNYGKIETSISWIHSTAPDAPAMIAGMLDDQNIDVKFYHMLGVEFANPNDENINIEKNFSHYKNLSYRKIILGFVLENNDSRWLTNTEISNGVIDAVMHNRQYSVIGKVRPWEMNPFNRIS